MNNEEINNQEVVAEEVVEETTAPAPAEETATPVEDAKPEDVTLNEDGSVEVAPAEEVVAEDTTVQSEYSTEEESDVAKENLSEDEGGPTAPESTGEAPVTE